MLTPQEAYSAAILRACEAHVARVKAARDTRVLIVSMAKNFGEHDPRTYTARSAAYARAKKAYDKAIRRSEAQRAKDEAIALAALRASGEVVLGGPLGDPVDGTNVLLFRADSAVTAEAFAAADASAG